jgi:SAM-dependent methyltransferase
MTTTKHMARETTTQQQNKGNGRPVALWTQGYEGACRVAETHVWEQFRDVGLELNSSSHIWDRIVKIPGRFQDEAFGHAPFAMHTIVTKSIYNPFSAWMTTTTIPRRRTSVPSSMKRTYNPFSAWMTTTTTPRPQTSDPSSMTNGNEKNNTCENKDSLDISWLGDSMVNQLVSDTVRTLYEAANSGIINSKSKGGQVAPFQILDVGCGVGGTLYTLASVFRDLAVMKCGSHSSTSTRNQHAALPPVKYRGISLASAEILQARGLAKWHGMNVNRVTFDQGSFDSASPVVGTSSNNNVVIAIESLAFSHNLTTTLQNIYNVLKPGGVLIVVEDVVVHASPQVKSYSATTDRPSLLSYSTWIQTLSSIGFSVDQVQDIGLQYELPQLFLSPSERKMLNRTNWWWWLGGQGEESVGEPVMLVERLLQWCEHWIKGPVLWKESVAQNSADEPRNPRFADLRTMQLFQDYFRLSRAHNLRRMAHSNGDLSYILFVLSKSK